MGTHCVYTPHGTPHAECAPLPLPKGQPRLVRDGIPATLPRDALPVAGGRAGGGAVGAVEGGDAPGRPHLLVLPGGARVGLGVLSGAGEFGMMMLDFVR